MPRRLLQRAGVAGALAVLGALAPMAPSRAAGGGYADLVALFKEWRAFQRPVFREGVPDYTPAAMEAQKARLPEFQRRLQAIAPGGWPVAQQIDWRLVQAEMNGLDFDHRVLRPWARDPGFYSVVAPEQSDTPSKEGTTFAGTLETWRLPIPLPAPAVVRFREQFRAIPAALSQAKSNLVEDTRDLWLAGIRVQKEQSAALDDLAKRLAPHHPDLVPDVEKARAAVDDFRAWLEPGRPESAARTTTGTCATSISRPTPGGTRSRSTSASWRARSRTSSWRRSRTRASRRPRPWTRPRRGRRACRTRSRRT